jgi:uncharacterized sulfatase
MKKRWIIKLGIGLFVSAFAKKETSAKINFVFFVSDDCTYLDLGCYGSQNVKTPNIDGLANEGVRFTRCFQAAPMCSPTRHNIYTGLYPTKTGAYPNHTFVQEGTQSIVQYMKPYGYRVALAGKRHIAPTDIFDFEYLGEGKKLHLELVDEFLSDVGQKDDPFCLFVCSREPHSPWNKGNPKHFNPDSVILPPYWADTPETRTEYCKYLAEIEYLDGEVGTTLQLLEKHGLADETVFIFTSEQGNEFPFAKWTCYNQGLHTAFIVRWPGKIKAGITSDCLIDYSDVVPTFLDIAGIPVPEYLDGLSLKNTLMGHTYSGKKYSFGMQTTRGIFFGSDYYGIRSVTDGQYRYIVNFTPEMEFENVATNSVWWQSWLREAKSNDRAKELVYKYQHRPAFELYDDQKDPYNQDNLINDPRYGAVAKKMKSVLAEWMKKAGDYGQDTELKALERIKKNAE